MTIYLCLQCSKTCKKKASNFGKFCSNNCQRLYQWEKLTKPQLEAGKFPLNGNQRRWVRYLTERDGYKCSIDICGISEWHGKPISLDIDHIDGNKDNTIPSNLRLICPNCHRQTPTWGNKTRNTDQRS